MLDLCHRRASLPSDHLFDDDGHLRVIYKVIAVAGVVKLKIP